MEAVQHKTTNRAATVQKPAASMKGVQRKAVAAGVSLQLQSSLKISSPKDPAEKEADVTAKKIMRMAVPESSIAYVRTGSEGVFRQVKKEEKEMKVQAKLHSPYITRFASTGIFTQPKKKEEEKIQRKAEGQPNVASNVAADIQNSMASGSPLPLSVRRFMEPRFQANFSNVKIQTGDKAAKLNRQLNAQAFTVGNQIFFGKDKFQPEHQEGKELIAHELTHTIQQGEAVQRSADVSVTQQSPLQVQRLGLSDALDYFADKANLIPGFRMFTIVLGVNPINMSSVDRSAANILRAIVEFIPGGGLITQALDNHGVFEKVGNWVEQQIKTLGMVGSSFKQAITQFLDSLSWSDIFDLGGVWNRAKSIFTDPINRIISFAKGLITGIIQFVKDAILRPLAKAAEGTEGYNMLKMVLGEDPVTGDPVAFDADVLIGGFMKLIGQEEVWNNLKKANGVARAIAWFNSAKASLMGFVRQIPSLFISAFKALELLDIVLVPRAFGKLVSVFGSFIGKFISWAGNAVWNLLEIIFDVVSPGAFGYVKKTGAALKSILKNPLPFVGNLVKAAKLGFQNFSDNIGGHLKKGLIEWLTGSLTGVYIPKALSLVELGKFALSVLGITWAGIRGKIVKVLGPSGEMIMTGLEKGFDIIVALMTGGPAAAWEVIKEQLSALKDMVVDGIIGFVTDTIVKKAIPKLVAMFIPGAGFISAIISIYDTVMVFVQKISKIIQVVKGFIDSIVAIAGGALGAAAKRVEGILSGLLSLAISFLAGFLGLGKVTDKIMVVIEKVRTKVDQAIDKAIAWIVAKAKSLFAKLFGKKDKDGKPDERSDEQKQRDLQSAVNEGTLAATAQSDDIKALQTGLASIRAKYKLTKLEVADESGDEQYVVGEINPKKNGPKVKKTKKAPEFKIKIDFKNAQQRVLTVRGMPPMMRHRNVGDQGKFNKPELQGATVTFTAESEVKEPTGKRQGSESQLPLAGLVGLSGYQRLHGIGHGFGAEFKFVTYGPKKVNLQLQNEAIESAIRFTKYGPKGLAPKLNSLQSKLGKPYEKYKDVKLIVVVEVVTQPGSMRTESVTYVIKTQQAGQKKPTKQGEISINITGDLRNPDYSFEFNADNAESNVGKEIMNSLRSAMALMLNEVMDIEERR